MTGTNGKTTTTELLGHIHREAGLPYAVAGNVGTALASLVGAVAPDAVVVAEAPRSSSRTPRPSRPRRPCCSTSRRTTSTATAPCRIPGGQAAGVRPPGADDLAVAPPTSSVCSRARPSASWRARTSPSATARWRGAASACSASTSSRCAAPTTRRTRWPPPRCAWPAASIPTPCAPGWDVPGRAPPPRGRGARRRRALRQRLQGHERRLHARRPALVRRAIHLIAGGRGQGLGLRGPARARGRALCRRLPDRRGRRRLDAALAGAGVPCAAAATSSMRFRTRAPPRSPATSCCSRPRVRATTSTRTTRRAAPTSAAWSCGADGEGEGKGARAPARAPDAPDGDHVPAGGGRGHGLLGPRRRATCSRAAATAPATCLRYVGFGAIGVVLMHVLSKRGLDLVRRYSPLLLALSFVLLLVVLLPGIGVEVNGANRWIGAGSLKLPALGAGQARARALRRRATGLPAPHPLHPAPPPP